MALTYAAGGATAGLAVVGLCGLYGYDVDCEGLTHFADLLFNGEGEAFNVRPLLKSHGHADRS